MKSGWLQGFDIEKRTDQNLQKQLFIVQRFYCLTLQLLVIVVISFLVSYAYAHPEPPEKIGTGLKGTNPQFN